MKYLVLFLLLVSLGSVPVQAAQEDEEKVTDDANNIPLLKKIIGSIGHSPNVDMAFMVGSWAGQNDSGSLKIQEIWSPAQDGQWFGARKIIENDNIEYQFFTFSYKKHGVVCWMRRFGHELDEPVNVLSRISVAITDINDKGKSTIKLPDNSSITYSAIDPQRISLTLVGKDASQVITLKKQ